MASDHPFFSLHRHGLLRVGAATPVGSVGDPAANAAAIIALASQADARGVDLVVFPELSISSYAIDDLHLQSALQRATDAALAAVITASATLHPVLLVGAALAREGRLYNCAVVVARGRVLGVVPKTFLPNYREYYEKRWFASGAGLAGLAIWIAGQEVPFGTDLIFAADDLPGFVFRRGDLRGLLGADPALDRRRARRRAGVLQPVRLQHRRRQGARARHAVRGAVNARTVSRLCLCRRRAGRKHYRSRLGRPGDDPRAG